MNRRTFFKTSAGLTAISVLPGVWRCSTQNPQKTSFKFRPYKPSQTLGTVTCVSPDDGYYIHSFYDVCPFSPSERYLAVTRFPYQDKDPVLGDSADVCIIDLHEQTIETVYSTKGWGFQLGANLNWGVTDRHLYTNDVIDGQPVCVQLDLEEKSARALAGPMYHLAPDESNVIGFPLDMINATQRGYGVPENPETIKQLSPGLVSDEGLWRTDIQSNTTTLFVPLSTISQQFVDDPYFEGGTFYFFHSKYNRQNTRIMQVFRCMFPDKKGGWNPQLFTFDTNGKNIQRAITREQWAPGGHHPNWHPDGEHLIINLKPDGKTLRFCQFKYDGSDFRVLSENRLGSGHPSMTPDSRYIVTDAYPGEPVVTDADNVPIRLFDVAADEEENICTMYTLGKGLGTLRLDPHPAWNRDYNKVCFNGAPEGKRQVFIADLSKVI